MAYLSHIGSLSTAALFARLWLSQNVTDPVGLTAGKPFRTLNTRVIRIPESKMLVITTRVYSVIRPKGSDLILDHPYNADLNPYHFHRNGCARAYWLFYADSADGRAGRGLGLV